MSTLLLRLAAPLQSWGVDSRFTRRTTQSHPSKSGVIGLLAAATGRRRVDPLEDLLSLTFGVRIDQPGRLERDFQTAHHPDGQAMPISHRFYLCDAVFLAAVEGPDDLVDTLDRALRAPRFPLYLGRRSCPPTGPVTLGTRDGRLGDVLTGESWTASPAIRRRSEPEVELEVVSDVPRPDAASGGPDRRRGIATFTCRDMPLSFDATWRRYATRRVVSYRVMIPNPDGLAHRGERRIPLAEHDPLAALEA